VKAFKGRSSHHLRKEFPHLLRLPSLWTSSYFVSTAGNISSETVKKYIEDPHHAAN
jgi:putative transposase